MRAFVATAAFLALSLSAASSFADEACVREAREQREECVDGGNNNNACWNAYRRNVENCQFYDRRAQERQNQMERANRGETTGIGNFQSIPQRPTYVLPGMR